MEKIYLDTSVLSAYFDDRDPTRQKTTQVFWPRLNGYEKYISDLVLDELSKITDPSKKEAVLKLAAGFQILKLSDQVNTLAKAYVTRNLFPNRYFADALHLAYASVHGINILISWNFEHLVKRKTRILANTIHLELKYPQVEIIAPPEL